MQEEASVTDTQKTLNQEQDHNLVLDAEMEMIEKFSKAKALRDSKDV